MTRQLTFDLPALQTLGRDDFFVSPSNAAAVAMIEGWQNWPSRKLLLIGQEGAGKTHLAHVWATLAKAQIVEASALSRADIATLARGPVAVENVPAIAGDKACENALFHLHNLTLAEGHSLLLTGTGEAAHWGLSLPDLTSRMQGTPAVPLGPPDDDLLAAVLMKLFADRQLNPRPDVLAYLTKNMERSFAAARRIVEALDAVALSEGREVSRKLAAEVLAGMA
ncbi:chromosomal replication initiator DnaA [Lentibacter sp. XHP0401]|jgi:chromosomal replication initiation ATPase DnaA|uniref:chromosomal replication initiator DnaA n=1 Tax=Lentibacter sp. XHP0401 TaxID=2984334 RepID=UPI0021E85A27|nr:chromosomal replication initiator DnaA [Lentibacter sp. XHP0401]MCV2891608.1 chromosomal replication initiator DnaA [Lentibacter sp. XHP0401]